jgi:hypothetical protein
MSDQYTADPPVADDLRHDDLEYNPAANEPKSALAWLNLLEESEKAFEKWNDHCDKLEKLYANLEALSTMGRDRQFQMFWANCEVIKPSIYARPPIPVVTTKFNDRREVYRAASEVLERCAVVSFDLTRINDLMLTARDAVALTGRGVAWCRYESGKRGYYNHEKVCIDYKHRRDFLHAIARSWPEVPWVAAASYLTRSQARKRFFDTSGDEYQRADYCIDKDAKEIGGADSRARAKFWEIWHKGESRVVWVAKGCENILDEDDPHLELQNFFPCPKPAYGTLQPGSLVPVPDVLQYKDQLDEINTLTARIHALSERLEAKGFYPAGGAEMADAITAAIKTHSPGEVLVPISNWAAFGGTKEVIVWLPIEQIASTITQCVALRKEIITDVYQVMGLSDIMRGSTDPNETLGAQTLKSEYGSVRIRDKQQELVRMARDLVEITSEIICEKFADKTIIEMSQTELPTNAMVEQQMEQVAQDLLEHQKQMQQVQQVAQQMPQAQQAMQKNPQMLQQIKQQFDQLQQHGIDTIKKLHAKPTIDQVLRFLRDNRIKRFVLDIETDSTIQADEDTEKKRRGEFIGVLAQLLPQLSQMIMADPATAEFCGELIKFATAPFRAGRPLDAAIDNLVAQMMAKVDKPRPDDPTTAAMKGQLQIEQMKDATNKEKIKAESALAAEKLKQDDAHHKQKLMNDRTIKQMELNAKQGDDQAKQQVQNEKLLESREAHQAHMLERSQDMELNQQKADLQHEAHQAKQQDLQARASERQAAQQFKLMNGPTTGGPL